MYAYVFTTYERIRFFVSQIEILKLLASLT